LSKRFLYLRDILSLSLCDYPGEPAAVLFLSGCNLSCPYCQNWSLKEQKASDLVDVDHVVERLARNPLITAVKVTGGEPLLQHAALQELAAKVKEYGLLFGVDTNGSLPGALQELLPYVDLVSIDVKAPLIPECYSVITGVPISEAEELVAKVKESLRHLFKSRVLVDVRTVVIPGYTSHPDDLQSIVRDLEELGYVEKAERGEASYTLAEYVPANARSSSFRSLPYMTAKELVDLAKKIQCKALYISHRGLGYRYKP